MRTRDGPLAALRVLLLSDPVRLNALQAVAALELPDCWIAAGFIRDAVWDHLHGRAPSLPAGDVDVIWFSPEIGGEDADREIEKRLRGYSPELMWSVKNQARMHRRNGDMPYSSAADAMTHWPETATAIALRLDREELKTCAPFGLEDLFGLRLRPTPAFAGGKYAVFEERAMSKRWMERYPELTLSRG